MDVVTAALRNLKKNAKPPMFKKAAYVCIGGILYPLIPTLIESLVKKDVMTGWTGVFTGALSGAAIGAMADKPEISAGAIGAAITHIMYVKANDTIQEFLQRPIFRFDKDSQLFDELPPGMQVVSLPDGQKIIAETNASKTAFAPATTPPMSDFQAIPPATPQMADFQRQLPATPQMSDFIPSAPFSPMSDAFTPVYGWN